MKRVFIIFFFSLVIFRLSAQSPDSLIILEGQVDSLTRLVRSFKIKQNTNIERIKDLRTEIKLLNDSLFLITENNTKKTELQAQEIKVIQDSLYNFRKRTELAKIRQDRAIVLTDQNLRKVTYVLSFLLILLTAFFIFWHFQRRKFLTGKIKRLKKDTQYGFKRLSLRISRTKQMIKKVNKKK